MSGDLDAPAMQQHRLSARAQAFIAASPFLLLMTTTRQGGPDVSPRGDPPGFVRLLNNRCLLIPDRTGNNRLDSLQNLLSNPDVRIVFLCPGQLEVLDIKGRCRLLVDEPLLRSFAVNGKPAQSVMAVDVITAELRESPALSLGAFWAPEPASQNAILGLGDILADQVEGLSIEQARENVRHSYEQRLY